MLYDFFVKAKVTSFLSSPSLVYTSLTKNGRQAESNIKLEYCTRGKIVKVGVCRREGIVRA